MIPTYVHLYLNKQRKKKLWNNAKFLVMTIREVNLFLWGTKNMIPDSHVHVFCNLKNSNV